MAPVSEPLSVQDPESQIPELFAEEIRRAHESALHSGGPVLIEKDGAIYEIGEGRTPKLIRTLPPATPMPKGKKIAIS